MFRDPLSTLRNPAGKAMAAPTFRTPQLALWPSGVARYDDGILEITGGDGLRVAAGDVVDIDLVPALGARLLLTIAHRRAFETVKRKYWVSVDDHDHLARLVSRVRRDLRACAC